MALGALGGDLGGILVPRWSKAETKMVRWPLPGSPFGSLFGHFSAHDRFRSSCLALFSYIILRFVFLLI